jgi:hypothetical protein
MAKWAIENHHGLVYLHPHRVRLSDPNHDPPVWEAPLPRDITIQYMRSAQLMRWATEVAVPRVTWGQVYATLHFLCTKSEDYEVTFRPHSLGPLLALDIMPRKAPTKGRGKGGGGRGRRKP